MKKTREELLSMSHEELADYTMELQSYYLLARDSSNKRLEAIKTSKSNTKPSGKSSTIH